MWHSRALARRFLWVLAAPLVAAGMAAGFGPAAASAVACQNWTGGHPPTTSGDSSNTRWGVAATAASNAWAAGDAASSSGPDQALALHCGD
jgi:hypothetical protein